MPVDPPLAAKLRRAQRKAEEWTAERDRLVVEARRTASLREVAAVLGVSHTAIAKIERRT